MDWGVRILLDISFAHSRFNRCPHHHSGLLHLRHWLFHDNGFGYDQAKPSKHPVFFCLTFSSTCLLLVLYRNSGLGFLLRA